MKISFPGGERQDFLAGEGQVRVGSAADNDVVLPLVKGVRAHHVELAFDYRRGITLAVIDAGSPVQVNGRPVKEKAILRLGDIVIVGNVRLVVRPDEDRSEKPPKAELDDDSRSRLAPPRVVLRAMAGSYFGKVIPLRARTVIGKGSECDLVLNEPSMSRRHAMIENTSDGLFLRDLGSVNGTYVNGTSVRDTVLRPGDQLAFDQNRFLIEAPGYLSISEEESPHTQVIAAIPRPSAGDTSSASSNAKEDGGVDWIIMTAAVVTLLALAVLVYLEFGGG